MWVAAYSVSAITSNQAACNSWGSRVKYLVVEVGAGELPDGTTSVIVEQVEGPPVLLLSGEVARCRRTMREWEATVEPEWMPSISAPLRLAV